jgi:exonuclease SbcC
MIITKIKIGSFGKLKNLELNFGEKLNIVYGPNEAGKTTLMAYIKAMFYGMDSRKRGIRENDRLRFLPWSGEDSEGELYYRDENLHEYKISRRFREKKREPAHIIDTVTGRAAPGFAESSPGQDILGLGEAAFTRTIYIPQLGSAVSPDKEDELMARLMNLQQTGDEQVSLQKVENALDDARKQITLRSGNGKLDRLLDRQKELRQEKEMVQNLYEENIADQLELNRHRDKLTSLHNIISRQEEMQVNLKKLKQNQEYWGLSKRAVELTNLEEEHETVKRELVCGENEVDQVFVQEIKAALGNRKQLEKLAGDIQKEIDGLSLELESIENSLVGFKGFDGLADDIEQEVFLKENKRTNLANRIREIENTRQEIADLERRLESKKDEMGQFAAFLDLTPDMEENIAQKEARKNDLEKQLKNDGQVETLQRDILVGKIKNAKIIGLIGLTAVLAGIIGGVLFNPWIFLMTVIGLSIITYELVESKKLKFDLEELDKHLNAVRKQVELRRELEELTKELDSIYERFGTVDSYQFAVAKRKIAGEKNELVVIEAKIRERRELLSRENGEALNKEHQECSDYLMAIQSRCSASSLEDFYEKLKSYHELYSQKELKLYEWEKMKSQLIGITNGMKEKEQFLYQKLNLKNEGQVEIGIAVSQIEKYEAKLKKINALEIQIEANRKNYQELLKGRDLAEMAAALEDIKYDDSAAGYLENEEELEQQIKETNHERVELEKKIVSIDSSINNRFKDCREISHIEEDLESTARDIEYYQELLDTLDLTRRLMTESFQEMQRSFGPPLNYKVGQILQGITKGKYRDVKIDEGYQVTIRDEKAGDKVADYFSNGTLDQVYFALRLGIAELTYNGEVKFPLILDDTFVQYDDQRLAAVLEYLLEYAQEHQVLLFTCHRREAELLQGKDFTYIELAE